MSYNLDIPNPYRNGKIFRLPPFRLFGAGPCNTSVSVIHALMSQPITLVNRAYFELFSVHKFSFDMTGYSNAELTDMNFMYGLLMGTRTVTRNEFELADEIKSLMKYVYQTRNPLTFVGQFSGNGGNETMVTNLADPGDTIVVASAGVWGSKVADMGRRYNLNVVELRIAPGEVYSFEDLEREIIKHKPVALFVTHGESSGGTLQPLDGLADICHKYDCLLSVDAVVSVGVAPLLVDKWKIDAVNGGSQKGLGAPPGMVLLSFSPRAHERILKKKHRPPYILDVLAHADVWDCFGNALPTYIYTYNTSMLAALRQALVEICEEGLENVWRRHRECSELFVEKIEKLGMKHFVKKSENRFSGVNCVVVPSDVDWHDLLEYSVSKHEIEFGLGIGPTFKKALRIGFMAQNAKPDLVQLAVDALEDGINYCRSENKIFKNTSNTYVFYDTLNDVLEKSDK